MLADLRRPATWYRVAHASHQYVLPAVAGTALTVGAGIAIASQAAPPVVAPVALIVAGATGVLSSFLYARRRAPVDGRGLFPPGARTRVAYDHPLASSPLYYDNAPPASASYPSADDSSRGSTVDTGDFPPHLRAGDQLWTQWTTSGVGELPVPFIGPMADTPYFPSPPERFDPFRSLTEEIQVAPFVPPGPRVATPPASGGVDLSGGAPRELTPLCRSPGSSLDPVMLEALSMYPPHLRSSITPVFPPPSLPAARDPSSLCVSCRVVPFEGTVWLPCPDCSGPVCGECVLASFDRDEDGWCSACARGRTPDGHTAAS